MTTIISNSSVRQIQAGISVSRTAAALPLNAAGTIFTVTGGRVLINALVGSVTAALGSTAQTLSIGYINSATVGGTSATNLATAGSVTSAGVTAQIIANPGGALTVDPPQPTGGAAGGTGGAVATIKAPFLVQPGSVTVTTNSNNGTGTVAWQILYTPVDTGAQVTAA